jgi:uncharacterized membrane protein
MKRKLRIAFLTSLILNLLLAGVIFGRLPQQFYGNSPQPGRFRAEVEKLPEPVRSRFREKIDEFRRTGLREQIREAREEMIRLLSADAFDEQAYDRQVRKMNDLRMQMSNRMAEDVREVVRDLPADQRHAVAELLKRPPAN